MVFKIAHHAKDGQVLVLSISTNNAAHSLLSDNPEIQKMISEYVQTLIFFALNNPKGDTNEETSH